VPAEPIKVVLRGDDADCGIVAISMYTDVSYADVVREVVKHDAKGGAGGLKFGVIRRTMAGLGHPVRWTKHVDFDEHYGLLWLEKGRDRDAHVVVLKHGQVVEPRSMWCGVWSAEIYLDARGYTAAGIFLSRE
jgi:hypothetical protein